ncbi:hypothetical protein Scep_020975 [Stephania cephalantha]|uniref:Core Histone H2A/H2B/H3 domain-containing protein n=1 Tax=Stephania cephalantha TaxID=152367 RepID=A0AAP0I118_9MAGN
MGWGCSPPQPWWNTTSAQFGHGVRPPWPNPTLGHPTANHQTYNNTRNHRDSLNQYPQQQQQPPPFQQLLQQQQQQLQMFWTYQRSEIEQVNDFRNHQLPLARIKKIMKADEDVRMISAEAPILFAKACELFILELTIRSWLHAEENKRRTLQKNDIAAAITRTDIFDFLVDIVPRDDIKDDPGLGLPYYGAPPAAGAAALTIGRPAMPGMDPGVYGVHAPSQAWQSVWQADEGAFGAGGAGAGAGAAGGDGQGYVGHASSD